MSAPRIEVRAWKPGRANIGPRIGFADILVPEWGVIIHDLRVMVRDGEVTCDRTQRRIGGPGEEPTFRPILSFVRQQDWKDFQAATLLALRAAHPEIFEDMPHA